MLDDWRTPIMSFACSCWKSRKSLIGNQGRWWEKSSQGSTGLPSKWAQDCSEDEDTWECFCSLSYCGRASYCHSSPPHLYNPDHSWCFRTMVQKLFIVLTVKILLFCWYFSRTAADIYYLWRCCLWQVVVLLSARDWEHVLLALALWSSHLVPAWIVFIFAIFSANTTAMSCEASATT